MARYRPGLGTPFADQSPVVVDTDDDSKSFRVETSGLAAGQQAVMTLAGSGTFPGTSGDVVGPAVAVNNDIVLFDGVTGKLVKDSGQTIAQAVAQPSIFNARLTLETGVAISTSDQLAKTTVYLTPFRGAQIALYDGVSAWAMFALAEISIALPAVASQVYDVFVYDAPGLTLELVAWTNDTTRATALATQNGILVKSGTPARRYCGTIRTTAVAGQCEDSLAKRYCWNYYNRVVRPMQVNEATDTWTYTTATLRQANANVANQLDFVVGVSEDQIDANVLTVFRNSTVGVEGMVGIGLDATNANATGFNNTFCASYIVNEWVIASANWRGFPGIGRHFLAWLEYSTAAGVTTWAGDQASPTLVQSGINGSIQG